MVQRGWREALQAEAEAGAVYDLLLADPPYDMLPRIAADLGAALAAVSAPGALMVLEHARGAMMGADGLPGVVVERATTRRYGDTEITVMWIPGEGT